MKKSAVNLVINQIINRRKQQLEIDSGMISNVSQ